jgi:hypothetical protein
MYIIYTNLYYLATHPIHYEYKEITIKATDFKMATDLNEVKNNIIMDT